MIKKDIEKETGFVPEIKYTVISSMFTVEGYSDKSPNEFADFIEHAKETGFRMLDQDGNTIALISPFVTSTASFIFDSLES